MTHIKGTSAYEAERSSSTLSEHDRRGLFHGNLIGDSAGIAGAANFGQLGELSRRQDGTGHVRGTCDIHSGWARARLRGVRGTGTYPNLNTIGPDRHRATPRRAIQRRSLQDNAIAFGVGDHAIARRSVYPIETKKTNP